MMEADELRKQLHAISEDAINSFGALTPTQLNWKPASDRWSVAQCLDHLITTNKTYEPAFQKVLSGDTSKTIWERLPIFPSLWASLLIKSLDPKSTRKLKAPKSFEPAQSELPGSIVSDFAAYQSKMIEQLTATSSKHLENTVITSPAAKVVTYTILDTFRIVVVHEQRHLEQAKRVVAEKSFPN